jgi:hypothetical protein
MQKLGESSIGSDEECNQQKAAQEGQKEKEGGGRMNRTIECNPGSGLGVGCRVWGQSCFWFWLMHQGTQLGQGMRTSRGLRVQ